VLIVDDEDNLRQLMARMLELEDFGVIQSKDKASAKTVLEHEPVDVMLLDVKLPDGFAIDWISELKSEFPCMEIVLLTAYGTIPDGVKAIKSGAYEYITKGTDNDQILPIVSRASEKARLNRRIQFLQSSAEEKHAFETVIGTSPAIRECINIARRVAETDTTVLLSGETGTGKEIFAQAIHYGSPRKNKPFVAVNCSAFSRELLESELFGYKAGAFTGAHRNKRGLFEEADQGTLFLDEIGELSAEAQAKLLRVIELGEFIKTGDTRSTRVNVRIIAATHRDLAAESAAGRFRQDLFYRISVFQVKLPALRDRSEDIPAFVEYFVRRFSEKLNKRLRFADKGDWLALQTYDWPGNIRELRNVIERAVILSDGEELYSAQLLRFIYDNPSSDSNTMDLKHVEREHIRKILQKTGGHKADAARLLGIGLTTLYRKIEEYALN
ncbi:MAG TPA: sigma-54 dependent transcriptional regulator, partial [bacterium]|nr:sigma-54 dependent transcriptional regulator [bacterium]